MYGAQTAGSDILLNYILVGKHNVMNESGRQNVDGITV